MSKALRMILILFCFLVLAGIRDRNCRLVRKCLHQLYVMISERPDFAPVEYQRTDCTIAGQKRDIDQTAHPFDIEHAAGDQFPGMDLVVKGEAQRLREGVRDRQVPGAEDRRGGRAAERVS